MIRRESRQFYLFPRKGIFSVQFVDPSTKKCLTAKSTGKTSRDEALMVVYDWMRNGIPPRQSKKAATGASRPVSEAFSAAEIIDRLKMTVLTPQDIAKIEKILKTKEDTNNANNSGSETLVNYLRRFWNYEKSPYVGEKLSHKLSITRRYVDTSLKRVNLYWAPYFGEKTLAEISRQELKNFSDHIGKNNPNLAAGTLRGIRRIGVIALRWAYANNIIPLDPTTRLPTYSSKFKKRGVLSPGEAARLFELNWDDDQSFLINLVGMVTGLRVSEILALQPENIGEEYLTVEHSFSPTDGLKGTKTEESKTVPIMPEIRDILRQLGETNPHKDGYIFYGGKSGAPVNAYKPLYMLKKMLIELYLEDHKIETDNDDTEEGKKAFNEKRIREAKEYWKKRNVVFHSWRHFYSARMADKIEARKVMLATGHKTEAVFQGYANHALENDLEEVASTAKEVFGGLLPDKIRIKKTG
jgi:integrase